MPLESILTVTQAAQSFDLTVLATVKLELGIDNNDEDDLLTNHIRQCSNAIMSYCRRSFALETVSEEFFPDECGYFPKRRSPIILARKPVVAITSVTLDGDALDTDNYRIDKANRSLFRLCDNKIDTWRIGDSLIVVYSAGYELLDKLPFDVERACILWIKDAYFSSDRDPNLRSEQNYNVATLSYFDSNRNALDPPGEVKLLLKDYRNVVFGK